jgi:hypothetical protein
MQPAEVKASLVKNYPQVYFSDWATESQKNKRIKKGIHQ